MIKRQTSLDIKGYEPKILFGLNKYQLISAMISICIALAATAAFGVSKAVLAVTVILCTPILLGGFVTFRGTPFYRAFPSLRYEKKNGRTKRYSTGLKKNYRSQEKCIRSHKAAYRPAKI